MGSGHVGIQKRHASTSAKSSAKDLAEHRAKGVHQKFSIYILDSDHYKACSTAP